MKTTKTVQGKIDPLNFLQLSIFDLPVQDTPTKLRYPNPKKAQKFRDLADRMQSQIDNKLGFAEKVSPKFMPLLTKNFLTNQ